MDELLAIVAKLRSKDGCPWDKEQTFMSMIPCTLEEAYEVADCIERNALDSELADELGDLLFQVVFYSTLADEANLFKFKDVVNSITNKLIRRHPHVFAEECSLTSDEVVQNWEKIKQEERESKEQFGTLANIPANMPALTMAYKIQKRVAKVGFDWTNIDDVIAKVHEEIAEVEAELKEPVNKDNVTMEIGDLLFAVVNLARHLDVDPELALRYANKKFMGRFTSVESLVKEDKVKFSDLSLVELDKYWDKVKEKE